MTKPTTPTAHAGPNREVKWCYENISNKYMFDCLICIRSLNPPGISPEMNSGKTYLVNVACRKPRLPVILLNKSVTNDKNWGEISRDFP